MFGCEVSSFEWNPAQKSWRFAVGIRVARIWTFLNQDLVEKQLKHETKRTKSHKSIESNWWLFDILWLLAIGSIGHDFARFKEVADEVQFCVQKQLQTNSGVEFPWASELAFCWSFTGKGRALPKQFYCLGGHCSFSRCSVKENTMRRRKSKQTRAPQWILIVKVRLPHDVPKSLAPMHT